MREPPHNYEAEQALLAALLTTNGVFGLIGGMAVAEDFADPLARPHLHRVLPADRAGRDSPAT
jgi:replicative DNA helicase